MKLSSSNQNKITEFKRIIPELEIIQGKDLKEVNGTHQEVILYKALDAGKDMIVEDTILMIDGVEVVDIRWNQEDKLKNAKDVKWIVNIGYNDGKTIYISSGVITGTIVSPRGTGFGFDPYVQPDNSSKTLAELEIEGKKDHFSARVIALQNFKNKVFVSSTDINTIKPWTGKYQNQ